jgi:hypothetical protein
MRTSLMFRPSSVYFAAVVAIALSLPIRAQAQTAQAPLPAPGSMAGTVTNTNGGLVPNASVTLRGPEQDDTRTLVTSEKGLFEFQDLKPGIPYQITVSAEDFADWISPIVTLEPGQRKIVTGIQLQIATLHTQVDVTYNPVEVATEQLKAEENQRVFGFIPNFYVSYDHDDAAPLTSKMKFELALKVSMDPITVGGIALVAAAKQAGNTPNFGQGWNAYGERFGATAADGYIDIMIGGAILPSLLHQDPRYFYQGTGGAGSRTRHAILSAFIAKGDNGKWQPNYSTMGGDLATSALSNFYYPKSNRGVGLVFGSFAIATVERISANLAQEFLFSKFTRRGAK